MPVVMYATFWLAKYGGITYKELMYDYDKTAAIAERAVLEFEPDACIALVAASALGRVFEATGFKQVRWPGHGVGDNQPYQYLDREYMKPEAFETFWWPSFRQMMIELIDAGLIPMPLWESDCTKRLEVIRDIPPGKCIYWFERTDMVKAFEVLGDVVALRGNLSPSMMTTGTPGDVYAAVKHLVDEVWNKGGKLILDTAFGIPDETPVGNVRAMFDAARKYAG